MHYCTNSVHQKMQSLLEMWMKLTFIDGAPEIRSVWLDLLHLELTVFRVGHWNIIRQRIRWGLIFHSLNSVLDVDVLFNIGNS